MKTWQWIGVGGASAVAVGLVVIAGLVAWGGPLADIRPDVITPDAAQPEREARGREVLALALEAHGGADAWAADGGQTFTMVDEWPGMYAWISPWGMERAELEVVQRRHTFDSTVTFADGRVWGITDGQPWTSTGGERTEVDDPNIRFILPTVHYFVEAPQRLQEAELVRYAGTRQIGGTTYDVVYATWGTWAANGDYDQYLIFVDADTHRIEKLEYTVRDMMRPIRAAIHYEDFVEVGDVTVATRCTVTSEVTDDPAAAGFMHRMVLSGVRVEDGAG